MNSRSTIGLQAEIARLRARVAELEAGLGSSGARRDLPSEADLSAGGESAPVAYAPPYGDLTSLNRRRTILDSLGPEVLSEVAADYLNLLQTSAAVYEVGGDYALGIFSSGWCRLLDRASRRACGTEDNVEALRSGKWHCHESCWRDASRVSIERGEPVDVPCLGGLRLYAVPVHAGGRVVGSMNFGYGDPPRDPTMLAEIAERYGLTTDDLREQALAYRPRSDSTVEYAKERLRASAKLVGAIVERRMAEDDLDDTNRQLGESIQRLKTTEGRLETSSRKVRESNERLMRANRELQIRNRIIRVFLTVPDDEMYSAVLKIVLEAMESEYGVFGYIDEEDSLVVPTMTRGVWSECEVPDKNYIFRRADWGDSSWPRAVREKKAIWTNEPSTNVPGGHIAIFRHISAPIIYDDDVVGLLQVANKHSDYTPDDVEVLETIGRLVAPVLDARLERDRQERGLRDVAEKTQAILDNLEIGVAIVDPDLKIVEANRKLVQWFPHADAHHDRVCREDLRVGLHGDGNEDCPAAETFKDGNVHEGRVRRTVDGELRIYRVVTSPIRDSEGDVTRVVEMVEDITERLKMEEQAYSLQRLESVGKLAGGVAHDFNNILSVVLGYGDVLLKALHEEDPLRLDVEEILKASRQGAKLTRQLLAFSRKQPLQAKVLDLNQVLAGIETMMRRLIGEDIDFRIVPAPDLYRVKADQGQIEQIIMNLAVNARDAMPNGGVLTIETANASLGNDYVKGHTGVHAGEYAQLSISDTGTGMTDAVKQMLFEPFFTTKEKGRGTGLGLSTVYGIVKQSGGNIWVYSELGLGTTFKIYLPRSEGEPVQAAPPRAGRELRGRGELLLVVEDESSLRRLMQGMLERAGYRVVAAANGGEALLAVEEKGLRPQLMITDVVMPGLSGKQLAARLQATQGGLRVLYISGYTDNAIVHHGILDEGVDFVQKPFDREMLLGAIRSILDAGIEQAEKI